MRTRLLLNSLSARDFTLGNVLPQVDLDDIDTPGLSGMTPVERALEAQQETLACILVLLGANSAGVKHLILALNSSVNTFAFFARHGGDVFHPDVRTHATRLGRYEHLHYIDNMLCKKRAGLLCSGPLPVPRPAPPLGKKSRPAPPLGKKPRYRTPACSWCHDTWLNKTNKSIMSKQQQIDNSRILIPSHGTLNVLSLFDGFGGGYLALQEAGWRKSKLCYFAVESDCFCNELAESKGILHIPSVISVGCRGSNVRVQPQQSYNSLSGDVTTITLTDIQNYFGKRVCHLLLAGPPCQDFSGCHNDKGSGYVKLTIDGRELVTATQRVIQMVTEHNRLLGAEAPHVVIENVSMKKDDLDFFTNTFSLEPCFLEAGLLSGTRRPRYYWTSFPVPEVTVSAEESPSLQSVLDNKFYSPFTKAYTIRASSQCLTERFAEKYLFRKTKVEYWNREGFTFLCKNRLSKNKPGSWSSPSVTDIEKLMGVPVGYTESPFPQRSDRDRKRVEQLRRHALGNGFNVYAVAHVLRGLRGN